MQQSREINELFSALAKAQIKLKAVPFDSKNPHFGNEFASLTAIQEATRPILGECGLSMIQSVESDDSGAYFVVSTLGHSSGQYIQSTLKLVIARNDMQSIGSATTYGKRYSWQSLIGVAGDQDDDGEAAVGRDSKATKSPPANKGASAAHKPPQTQPPANGRPPNMAPAGLTDIKRIDQYRKERQITPEEFSAYLKNCIGAQTSKDLKADHVDTIMELLQDEATNSATLMAMVARAQQDKER